MDTLEEQAFGQAYGRLRRQAREKLRYNHRSVPIDSLCQRLANTSDISLQACIAVWTEDIRERRISVWETAGNLNADYIRGNQLEAPKDLTEREQECREELFRQQYPPIDRERVLQEMAGQYPFARALLRQT